MMDFFSPLTRMLIRLFIVPALLLVLLMGFYGVLSSIAYAVERSLLADLALALINFKLFKVLFLTGMAVGVLWMLYQGYRVYDWLFGSGSACWHCGCLETFKQGRHRLYYQCLGCGKKREV